MPEQFIRSYHTRSLDSHWKLALSALPTELVAMYLSVIGLLFIRSQSKVITEFIYQQIKFNSERLNDNYPITPSILLWGYLFLITENLPFEYPN